MEALGRKQMMNEEVFDQSYSSTPPQPSKLADEPNPNRVISNSHRPLDSSTSSMATSMDREKETNCRNEEKHEGDTSLSKLHLNISADKIPYVDQEFETDSAAHTFYNAYAKLLGFSTRKQFVRRRDRIVLERTFCCSCEGIRRKDKRKVTSPRPETRKGCLAMMKINICESGKYKVMEFIAIHCGHNLAPGITSHMLRSHRKITDAQRSQVDAIEGSGISPKDGFELMSRQVGGRGNVGFMIEDYKNYLRSKRTIQMEVGDSGAILQWLQQRQTDDPNFFYAIQLDEDSLMTNIFWADVQMKADYAYFGDVVSFDTTHRKNKHERPFALFVGVNHHWQTTIFGSALLYDKTAPLTDEDAAMAKALRLSWKSTQHRLCIWHIFQNVATHLSGTFARFEDFQKDLRDCIYNYEEEDAFFDAWTKMLERYDLQTNGWLDKMFGNRKKWALVYGRQKFCGGMTTTSRSESIHSSLKRYVCYKHNMLQFCQHFQRLLEHRRYEELKEDVKNSQSTPVLSFPVKLLLHVVEIYTHEVFDKFQRQLSLSFDCRDELVSSDGDISEYKIFPSEKLYHHKVKYISSTSEVLCSCKRYEFVGILCSHALKVLNLKSITRVPDIYIMKRWTKTAKKGLVEGKLVEPLDENDEKKMIAFRYQELCQLNNQIATRAALTFESYEIARKISLKAIEEIDASLEKSAPKVSQVQSVPVPSSVVDKVHNEVLSREEIPSRNPKSDGDDVIMVKGLKVRNKENVKSGKRRMNALEKAVMKKKSKTQQAASLKNSHAVLPRLPLVPLVPQTPQEFQVAESNASEKVVHKKLQKKQQALGPKNSRVVLSRPPLIPQAPQEFHVGESDFSMYYPILSSDFTPFQASQINVSPSCSVNEQHVNSNLTDILQGRTLL